MENEKTEPVGNPGDNWRDKSFGGETRKILGKWRDDCQINESVLTTPQLLAMHSPHCETLQYGKTQGRCVMCGIDEVLYGNPATFPKTFTGYSYLQAGECLCPACHHVITTQKYRGTMWAVSPTGFQVFKHAEARQILLHPPEPPFAIMLTRTWKKQGWLLLINRVNFNRDYYVVAEDLTLITINRRDLTRLSDRADYYLGLGLTKTTLIRGVGSAQLKYLPNPRENAREIRLLASEMLWETAVRYSPIKWKKRRIIPPKSYLSDTNGNR